MFGRRGGPSLGLGNGDEEEKDLRNIKEILLHKQGGTSDQLAVPSG